jgi:hypothetical protein
MVAAEKAAGGGSASRGSFDLATPVTSSIWRLRATCATG